MRTRVRKSRGQAPENPKDGTPCQHKGVQVRRTTRAEKTAPATWTATAEAVEEGGGNNGGEARPARRMADTSWRVKREGARERGRSRRAE